jgi:TonB family protein
MGCADYFQGNENYTLPTLKEEPRLFYPMDALQNSYSGTPRVVLYISKTGKVEKVRLLKSSGFEVLDNAAIDYSKNFIFNPAQRNGSPIDSRIAMDIKFEFSNQTWNANKYVSDIKDLYEQLSTAVPLERNYIETEIFEKHNEFNKKMRDLTTYNQYIGMVISQNLNTEWKNNWNSYPLSFLLYHDFIQRFPDYNKLDDVKEKLESALKYNIQYIKSTQVNDRVSKIEKNILLSKIKNLVKNEYPDMINNIGLDIKVDTISVF